MFPDLEAFETEYAQPATATPPDAVPVSVSVIWDVEEPASGAALSAGSTGIPENWHRVYIRRDQLAELPVGTIIEGAPEGMPVTRWRVNRVDPPHRDPQYHCALVSEEAAP